MAQLIKIEDYTSRYEQDIQRYPSQFSRLKHERWLRMKNDWLRANRAPNSINASDENENWFEKKERNFFADALERLRQFANRRGSKEEEVEIEQEGIVTFYKGKSIEELKEIFYEELFQAQLRWASASLYEESALDSKYKYDIELKKMVKWLPDNYMIMYYPVMKAGRAAVEMEIILISPTEILLLVVLSGRSNSVFSPAKGRYWIEYIDRQRKQVVSPFLSLNRMYSILQDSVSSLSSGFHIQRVLYSPNSIVDFSPSSGKIEIVDKRNINEWMEKKRKNPAPIKKSQLEIAETLLEHAVTSSAPRQNIIENETE